jgi:glycosyltransferase involved in cell wall biosynthesis
VAPGDAEELAAVLRRLHDSPAERERVGKAGYDRVMERFTWHVVAKRTVEAYREAIAAHTGGRAKR